MQRQVFGELFEFVIARHEVGLGIDFDQHAQPPVVMVVCLNDPIVGSASGFLFCGGDSLLAQVLDRFLHIAACLFQCFAAVDEARAGDVPQFFNRFCRNFSHV